MFCEVLAVVCAAVVAAGAFVAFTWAKGVEARLADMDGKLQTVVEDVSTYMAGTVERNNYVTETIISEMFSDKYRHEAGDVITKDEIKAKIAEFNTKVKDLWLKRSDPGSKQGRDWVASSSDAGAELREIMRKYRPQSSMSPLISSKSN